MQLKKQALLCNFKSLGMRQMYLIFFGALTMMYGCSKQGLYEKSIAAFVQTDKKGTWTDLQFKVIEMGTPTEITVADSIRILTDAFEAVRKKKLDFATEGIERNKRLLEKDKSATMRRFYQEYIDKQQEIVDSLLTLTPSLPKEYSEMNVQKVLAQEIVCKFSIVPPIINARQEMTETFILSADGSKCYRRKIMKNK